MSFNSSTLCFGSANRGFTIIELMVTMFLAAILFGLAIPSFRSVIAGNRLVTQTNDMIGAMTLARSEAITRNGSMTFCRTDAVSDTTCGGGTVATTWGSWIVRDPAGNVVRSGSIPTYGGAIKVTSNFTNNTIVYSSDGLARNGASTGTLLNTQLITVCAGTTSNENIRQITPGSGARLSTAKSSGGC